MEESRTSKILWALFFALLTGITLALFTQIEGMIKYLFSLAGLYLVIKYFKRAETMSYRILYVVLTLLFFFATIIVLTTYLYMKQNY